MNTADMAGGGLYMVGLYDRYDSTHAEMVEPKVSWVVETIEKADELLQFVQAWVDENQEYGDLFAVKIWVPSVVTPSATLLGQARTELNTWLEENS